MNIAEKDALIKKYSSCNKCNGKGFFFAVKKSSFIEYGYEADCIFRCSCDAGHDFRLVKNGWPIWKLIYSEEFRIKYGI